MSNRMRGIVCIGVIAAGLSVQSLAHAGVSNPDYYFISIPGGGNDSIYDGGSGGGVVKIEGQLEGDLDASGNWTFGGASFVQRLSNITIGGTGVYVQPIVVASGTSGTIDPGSGVVSLTLRMRLKFTNGGTLGTSCQTPLFTVTMTNSKSFLGGSGSYSVGTGQFIIGAQDVYVDAAPSCNGNEAAVRNAFGLQLAAGNVAFKFDYGVINNPQVPAP